MAIKYELHSIKNSAGSGEDRKFVHIFDYPAMSERNLEEKIEHHSSLTRGDVKAVLSSLHDVICEELSNGNRVFIPEIGYLSLTVGIDMPEDKPIEKIKGNNICVKNINFKPTAELLQELKQTTRFEKAQFTSRSKNYTEEEMQEKLNEYFLNNDSISRREMEFDFHLSRYGAQKWLKHFVETGVLKNIGKGRAPVYVRVAG